jgi:hypothetical protein
MMHEWASLPDTLVSDLPSSRMVEELDAQLVGKEFQTVRRGQKYCENQYRETRPERRRPGTKGEG